MLANRTIVAHAWDFLATDLTFELRSAERVVFAEIDDSGYNTDGVHVQRIELIDGVHAYAVHGKHDTIVCDLPADEAVAAQAVARIASLVTEMEAERQGTPIADLKEA